jgi:hypothetical protein
MKLFIDLGHDKQKFLEENLNHQLKTYKSFLHASFFRNRRQ